MVQLTMITIVCSEEPIHNENESYCLSPVKNLDPSVYGSFALQKCLNDYGIEYRYLSFSELNQMLRSKNDVKQLIAYYEPLWSPEFKHLGVDLFESEFLSKHLPEIIVDLARQGRLKIVLSTVLEPYTLDCFERKSCYDDKIIIPNTQRTADKLNIPGDQVIVLSGDLNAERKWVKCVNEHNTHDPIKVKSFMVWGGYYRRENVIKGKQLSTTERLTVISEIRHTLCKPAEKRTIEKTFVSFNRKLREHRVLLIELLSRYNLLNDGFVSCPATIGGETFENVAGNIYIRYREQFEIIDHDFLSRCKVLAKRTLPLMLDVDVCNIDASIIQLRDVERTIEYYNKSFCSIVAETAFDGHDVIFLTEKVFKPIIVRQPFLLISQRHSLRILREYGFKTFDPFIDESYDNFAHWIDRTHGVVQELRRLSRLSRVKQLDVLLSLKEILDHNFAWYFGGFQELVKSELRRIVSEMMENNAVNGDVVAAK